MGKSLIRRWLVTIAAALFIGAAAVGLLRDEPTPRAGGENDLTSALLRPSAWPTCGFPPAQPAFDLDHAASVRVVRCLERRGLLSSAAALSYDLDRTFALRGAWDGEPYRSALRWTQEGSGEFTATWFTLDASESGGYLLPLLVLAGVATAIGLVYALRRRRGRRPGARLSKLRS